MSLFSQLSYATSAATLAQLPQSRVEIAFAGRSNAGKSSAINTLAGHKRLAFVSKTPGRTQLINFFGVDEGQFIVDLPGYGYAKVPAEIRERWENVLSAYLQTREALAGLVLIMDARHPLTPLDRRMLDWFLPRGLPVHILLTKADKLSRGAAGKTLHEVRKALKNSPQVSVQLFSSLAKQGIEEAEGIIKSWLLLDDSR
ncbi:MAG: YihA family ribosome biogenesis GTP-binding protein [Hydrogenophilaceae bacterium]|nr:YihA family ribosome biogenesis GTP-binding protein [Hydrogenophilaceae bacterium]